ncbi:myb-like protein D [Nasonia vitripennis]|uniref:Uncharacterized protein n=1 Tax=Nasonia vitripennis TaxID=7425 RepID=A0A7M7QHE5_NASVI|nr:myb-like protein D [Nasonia vitripennis]
MSQSILDSLKCRVELENFSDSSLDSIDMADQIRKKRAFVLRTSTSAITSNKSNNRFPESEAPSDTTNIEEMSQNQCKENDNHSSTKNTDDHATDDLSIQNNNITITENNVATHEQDKLITGGHDIESITNDNNDENHNLNKVDSNNEQSPDNNFVGKSNNNHAIENVVDRSRQDNPRPILHPNNVNNRNDNQDRNQQNRLNNQNSISCINNKKFIRRL